ncbi:hypothetical protein SERLA73DRAFT_157463 [Serpula lacrymans var. lacrymans S7.3]|uniref:Uncharacterized protein n=1 Tax=Serpula lacrymans var. lacrymans (strain S7.3) TaxID=936435 RepID=F8QJ55_SERL3|nr:hypothetical protein SERLA73DRAFT_157463 [Serpula lacrymans var. lacrymans S7.3]
MDVDSNLDASEDVLLEVQKPTIGQNQYKNCRIYIAFMMMEGPKDDQHVNAILTQYHHDNITGRKLISKLLASEHGISMSEATVARRRLQLGLLGSTNTIKALTVLQKRQLVMDQLAQDPLNCCGPCIICEAIVAETEMVLLSGVRDQWSGKWLGLWVVPNNRLKTTIGYPVPFSCVCLFKIQQIVGVEYFSPHLSPDELPAHRFLKSVHNITIEHGWHSLRIQWGDNLMKAVADDVIGPSPYGQLHCVRELSLKVKERQRGARKGNAAWHFKV